MAKTHPTRRTVLATGAAAGLTAPFVRGAHAAGKLNVGFWDHWVPGANDVLRKLAMEWAEKEKVDLTIDFITSTGEKILITIAAERQARTGHDILPFGTWQTPDKAEDLEPADDVVKALMVDNGNVAKVVEYLGNRPGPSASPPPSLGNQPQPPS